MIDSQVAHIRTAHGAIMSVTFLALKPAGAILIRALNGRLAFQVHVIIQSFAMVVAGTGVALGIYVAKNMDRFGKAHVILGFVTIASMIAQALLGYAHHQMYLKLKRRTSLGTTHVWLGRLVLTFGIINGGIGLGDANNTVGGLVAYIVIAAVDFVVYIVLQVILVYQQRSHT